MMITIKMITIYKCFFYFRNSLVDDDNDDYKNGETGEVYGK